MIFEPVTITILSMTDSFALLNLTTAATDRRIQQVRQSLLSQLSNCGLGWREFRIDGRASHRLNVGGYRADFKAFYLPTRAPAKFAKSEGLAYYWRPSIRRARRVSPQALPGYHD